MNQFFNLFTAILVFLCLTRGGFAEFVDFNEEGSLKQDARLLFVSLGSHCEVALTLRDSGLREAAFPFDWLDSRNLELVGDLLDEDFAYFTDEKYLARFRECPAPNTVFHTRYEIRFHHDWPFDVEAEWSLERFQQQVAFIQKKYTRRIERFRELRHYPGKVYFIRELFWEQGADVTQSGAQVLALKEALDRYFPSLDFTLVIINFTDDHVPDIPPLESVVEFKIVRPDWREEFIRVYKALGARF